MKPKTGRYQVEECELQLNGYDIFHNMKQAGRGIALYTKKELKASLCEDLLEEDVEAIFIECHVTENERLTVGLVYRSDNKSTDSMNERLNALIVKASEKNPGNLLIIGDFNFPQINWDLDICETREDHKAYKFYQTTKDAYLIQHQKLPTRYREGQKENILDLVLTNREELISEIRTTAGLGKSDHHVLLIDLNCHYEQGQNKPRYNYSKTDVDKLNEELSKRDWDREFEGKNVNEAWTVFKEIVEQAVNLSTPKTSCARRGKSWMNKETLEAVKLKHKSFRVWRKSRKQEDFKLYAKARNLAKKMCRKAQSQYEAKIARDSKNNPKPFWRYTQSRISSRSGVSDLRMSNGQKTKSDYEKADTLNMFFQSVFTKEEFGPLPKPPNYQYETELKEIDITEKQVKKILSQLNRDKASGPDNISPKILTSAATTLSYPVTLLFRLSLANGEIPEDWRTATVSPIFKKGSRAEASNYRPVSLTCILCKCMEKIVREKVMNHLLDNNLITKEQHGFVPGKSCTTQLLEVLDEWTEILDDGGSIDAVYMDFQKAFDTVPHRRLLEKIKAHGITGKICDWIEAFLRNRRQRVVVGDGISDEASVWSGIPQGSVIGPLLFVLFINDLPACVQTSVKIFADDTKVYTRSDKEGATNKLQNDLQKLQDWSDNWQLRFHPEKCSVMKLGKNKSKTKYCMYSMDQGNNIREVPLKEIESEKDLGVTIDNSLNFKLHIAQITAKANRMVGIIRRSFNFLNEKTFTMLFKSLVRPLLEYGNTVWSPMHKSLEQDIENVQRRATKLIGSLKEMSYTERLKRLKLPSLEHRRVRGDMIQLYKYLHGHYSVQRPQFQLATNEERTLRGNSLKIKKNRFRLDIRGNFFSNRTVNMWNNLPNAIVTAPSLNAFKARIDKHWEQLPTVYDPACYKTT